MFNIGPTELIVILLVALLVVGPKRLPDVGKTIGRSLKEFRKAQEDLKSTFNFDLDEPEASRKPFGDWGKSSSSASSVADDEGDTRQADAAEESGEGDLLPETPSDTASEDGRTDEDAG